MKELKDLSFDELEKYYLQRVIEEDERIKKEGIKRFREKHKTNFFYKKIDDVNITVIEFVKLLNDDINELSITDYKVVLKKKPTDTYLTVNYSSMTASFLDTFKPITEEQFNKLVSTFNEKYNLINIDDFKL